MPLKVSENLTKYPAVFSLGFFGLLAQTLLFRTFLITFDGNELSIGLFFFSWLIWVCVGAWFAKRKVLAILSSYFPILILLYLPLYVLQQYLFINVHNIIGSYAFEMVSLDQLILFVLLFNAPISFMTGLLFVLGTDWMKKSFVPVIKIYVSESLGSFVGALLVTILLFFGYLDESIYLIAALIVLFSTLPYLFFRPNKKINILFRIITPALIAGVVFMIYKDYPAKWDNYNNRSEWHNFIQNGKYLSSFSTPQTKYLYGTYKGEFIVTAWNSTYEALPNTENSSRVVGAYLSQNPNASNVLVVGPGSFSICRTFSQLPQIKKIVSLDTDPVYSKHLLKILPKQYKKDIGKIEIPRDDIRKYIINTGLKFDLIVLNIPNPTTLLLNKFFTIEFFKQLNKILTSRGVIGISFPAGANYMGTELSFMGSSLLYTLRFVYDHIVLQPGDESCFFVSNEPGIVSDSGNLLVERLKYVKGITKIFYPENIRSFFEKNRINFQMKKYMDIIDKYPQRLLNTDKDPKAFLYTLLFTIKKLGNVGFSMFGLNILLQAVFPYAILIILLYFLLRVFYYYCYATKGTKSTNDIDQDLHLAELYFATFISAIAGLGINLILIFLFQIYFGSVFLYFGLITALFMLGLFISGLIMERLLKVIHCRLSLFFVSLLSLFYILLIYYNPPEFTKLYFAALFLSAGLLSGPFFAITAYYLKKEGISEIQSASRLEIIDNLGGAFGSIICSIILIPIIGINRTLVILFFAWSIIILLSMFLRGRFTPKISWLTRFIRIIGFSMFAVIVIIILTTTFYNHKRKIIDKVAWKLSKSEVKELGLSNYNLLQNTKKVEGKQFSYYLVKDNGHDLGYIYRTKDFTKDDIGYAGPIQMLSFLGKDGNIQNFTIEESSETPTYLKETLKSKQLFLGQNVLNAKEYQINAITGATITSSAISKILFNTGTNFSNIVFGEKSSSELKSFAETYNLAPLILLFLFTIIAIILRIVNSKWGRYLFLGAVVVVLGVIFNLQYSVDQIYSLISFHFYFPYFNSFLFLCLLIPILIMFFGNIYCGYLCPFGALQELLFSISNPILRKFALFRIPKLHKVVWQLARTIKYLLLFCLIILFLLLVNKRIGESIDVLQHAFSFFFSSNFTLYLIIFLILVSLCYKRFWCRVFCPSGAFLSLFNAIRLLRRKNKIQVANCDIGVFDKKAFDCICCDNCRKPKKASPTIINQKSKLYNYFFLFFVLICFYYILILLRHDYDIITGIKTDAKSIPLSKLTPQKETVKFAPKSKIKSIGTPRNVDIEKYKSYINKKHLSNHPAMYYKKLLNKR